MNPQQALQILADATSTVAASRDQHLMIIKAIETLKGAIAPKDKKEEPALTFPSADAKGKKSKTVRTLTKVDNKEDKK